MRDCCIEQSKMRTTTITRLVDGSPRPSSTLSTHLHPSRATIRAIDTALLDSLWRRRLQTKACPCPMPVTRMLSRPLRPRRRRFAGVRWTNGAMSIRAVKRHLLRILRPFSLLKVRPDVRSQPSTTQSTLRSMLSSITRNLPQSTESPIVSSLWVDEARKERTLNSVVASGRFDCRGSFVRQAV